MKAQHAPGDEDRQGHRALENRGLFRGHVPGAFGLLSHLRGADGRLAGRTVTAVESLLFGDASARIKNWPVGTPYQAQSACNNAALALVTLVILAMPETERTDAALATTTACTLLFILLSGVNHLSHAKDASIHKPPLLRRREPPRLGRRGHLQAGDAF